MFAHQQAPLDLLQVTALKAILSLCKGQACRVEGWVVVVRIQCLQKGPSDEGEVKGRLPV